MILRTCDMDEFINRIKDRNLVCFGAGRMLSEICEEFSDFSLEKQISYIVDNNPALWGTKKCLKGRVIDIKSPGFLYTSADKNTIIMITCGGMFGPEVFESLEMKPELRENECYFASFFRTRKKEKIKTDVNKVPDGFRMNSKPVIPKKIHYCWFGRNPIPEKNMRYIDSWKRYCPDYEIIEWNESNYDYTKNRFMKEAYDNGKWSFVSDYARIDIIYNHGGIYLDTDVEVIKPLDELLYNNAFCGFESIYYVASGLGFGGVTNFPLFKEIRDSYNNIKIINEAGTLNLTACPKVETEVLMKHGLKQDGGFQVIDGLTIYPVEYFSPLSYETRQLRKTSDTFSIHWFEGSWQSDVEKYLYNVYLYYYKRSLGN